MFSHVQGGQMPARASFPWHPVLMTLAFPCLMTWGRHVYTAFEHLPNYKRWRLHRSLMLGGGLAMLMGYLCIFLAHLPHRKFFGHNFDTGGWSEYKRILHAFIGYIVIFGVIMQSFMGFLKTRLSTKAYKTFTFHGTLGKGILLLAALNMIIAVRMWAW